MGCETRTKNKGRHSNIHERDSVNCERHRVKYNTVLHNSKSTPSANASIRHTRVCRRHCVSRSATPTSLFLAEHDVDANGFLPSLLRHTYFEFACVSVFLYSEV